MATQDGVPYYWAKALFAAAKKHHELDQVDTDLHQLLSVITADKAAHTFFNHPRVPVDDKVAMFEHSVKSRSAHGLLSIMFGHHHGNLLPAVAARFRALLKEHRNMQNVEVRVPFELSPADRQRLGEHIRKAVGADIELTICTDPSIIGGILMKVGTVVYDGTFRKDLNLLKERLLA